MMSEDTLSQEAIDRLLHEMAEGKPLTIEENQSAVAVIESPSKRPHRVSRSSTMTTRDPVTHKRIRDYDFRRPNRISKEHMRGLRLIHETFCREIPRVWGPLLRAGGQVKIISMEQTIYEEYRNHLSPHCMICTATLLPLEGEIAFHMELEPAFIIIDRLLGGAGSGIKRTRELTTLELNLMQRVIRALLPTWREAWLPTIHLEPEVGRALGSTEFLQLTASNESVLVTTFQARFLNTDIEMTICIPYAVIAPILTRVVSSENLPGHITGDETDQRRMVGQMHEVPVDVTARLGSAPIPIADLSQLAVGDVIRLDVPIDGKAVIHIGERPHFMARPGLSNGNLAVQITEVVRHQAER
ncbi:MAG TPA: FliM/FliN family flagellar motor switch protein [Ktedonobacterales bacterium]|nr:FliM/FliN family flagellar motor switch protein [Ktedonobacterales bacterium]